MEESESRTPGGLGAGSEPARQRATSLLRQHHAGGVTEEDCRRCSSPCCRQGGFAILENVLEIYAAYRDGALARPDHTFTPGLGFGAFVAQYFDIWRHETGTEQEPRPLLLFHMKHLAPGGHLISIPGVEDYWVTRRALFADNPWLNRGCVFLSRDASADPHGDDDTSRRCLLHPPGPASLSGRKPVGCVYYTCEVPRRPRESPASVTDPWLAELAQAFPHSVERLQALLAHD